MTQRPAFSFSARRRFAYAAMTLAAASSLALSGCADGDAGSAPSAAQPTTITSSAADTVPNFSGDSALTADPSAEMTFADAWGPSTGSQIPQLAAPDHTGQPQTLDSLSGDKGLLLVFSRSADW